jgi:shikimate kinase
MNILLSGPPFSGKTTIGELLAKQLHWEFINTDHLLENKHGTSCSELHRRYGEEGFRKLEKKELELLLQNEGNHVISLGGGALENDDNSLIIKKLGKIIYLNCSFEELYRRLKSSGRTPAYLDPSAPEQSFRTLVKKREANYAALADFILDVTSLTPKQAVDTILRQNALLNHSV